MATILVARLPIRYREFSRYRNLDYVAFAIPEGIALVAYTMVGSPATVDLVVPSFAIHAVNEVVLGPAKHRVRTATTLQKVAVGVAEERIGTVVTV